MKSCRYFVIMIVYGFLYFTMYPSFSWGTGRGFEKTIHNANNIEMYTTNYGILANKTAGILQWEPGLYWPKGSGHDYGLGIGPWFAAIEQSTNDTLVTVGFWLGDGSSEWVPGLHEMPLNDPDARIYMYPSDWPPPISVFPMAPQAINSFQDSWTVYNDLNPKYHHPFDTRPIGLEVYQTIYAWDIPVVKDVIYIKFDFKNVSENELKNCYFGLFAPVGTAVPTNEIIGMILERWYEVESESVCINNIAYLWQVEEEWWNEVPGVIGIDLLQTPWDLVMGNDKDKDGIPDEHERDSIYYVTNLPDSMWDIDGDLTPDWRDPSEIPQLGMTAFKDVEKIYPHSDPERYLVLAGYDYRTMLYNPYDSMPSDTSIHILLLSSGPFNLSPDSMITVVIGIMITDWYNDYQLPDTALAEVDYYTQLVFDKNWMVARPPAAPNFLCVPGDAEITLIWDNVAEFTPDPYYQIASNPTSAMYDSFYREFDFEGYRVWKSLTGKKDDWRLLAQCDLYNNITFEDTLFPDSLRIKAVNSGIFHSFVDDNVRNGFDYYYAITAFDYNYTAYDTVDSVGNPLQLPLPFWYESGFIAQKTSPRREPANLVPGSCSLEVIRGNQKLISVLDWEIVYPLDMDSSLMTLDFAGIDYDSTNGGSKLTGYLRDNSNIFIDSVQISLPNANIAIDHSFTPSNGVLITARFLKDSLVANKSIFSNITVATGTYPESLLVPSLPGPWASYFAYWPYRGNDYKIEWKSTHGGGDANTVIVTDTMSKDTIKYSAYNPEPGHEYDSLANGWCFLSHLAVSDTLVLFGSPPATNNTKYLYINGGLIGLKKGGFLQPGDILPKVGDIWYVKTNETFQPVLANAVFRIHSQPAYIDVTEKRQLNVKVVPNPFLIHNEWHTSLYSPRIRFINLPADCTIRIFTLSGELIDVIQHHDSNFNQSNYSPVDGNAGGDEWWNLQSLTYDDISSGVYIFHVDSDVGEQVGKFVVIR